jgi:hypothetical protein
MKLLMMLTTLATASAATTFGRGMRDEFLFAPNFTSFNFGGYGAMPKPVFEAQKKRAPARTMEGLPRRTSRQS